MDLPPLNQPHIGPGYGTGLGAGTRTMGLTQPHASRMSTKKQQIIDRSRRELASGSMDAEECKAFDLSRAYEMHRAELRRHPELAVPELPLERAA